MGTPSGSAASLGSSDHVHVSRCSACMVTDPHLLEGSALLRKSSTCAQVTHVGSEAAQAGPQETPPQGPLRGRGGTSASGRPQESLEAAALSLDFLPRASQTTARGCFGRLDYISLGSPRAGGRTGSARGRGWGGAAAPRGSAGSLDPSLRPGRSMSLDRELRREFPDRAP